MGKKWLTRCGAHAKIHLMDAEIEEPVSEFCQHVAVCIKAWREGEPSLSREDLASKMDRSMATVQRWERDGDPRLSEVDKMNRIKPGLVDKIFPRRKRSIRAA
ncbi:MAG: helix-turn-helix transcriptional regulator [Methanomicrobiales archaeon]|nr:helix-turn-helix transcriptional regulator [Methanomicrobiales archaeon]